MGLRFSLLSGNRAAGAMDFPHGWAGGEEVKGVASSGARDYAGSAPGNLDDKSVGQRSAVSQRKHQDKILNR
jgi:hypothetical protein